ncbi:PREDICTED: uncharacterized protein LOC108570026 [Nicrophorus vespilloides]|uniref:Uncharacterized protein LOC108570026 n=1 Tax=Nicrophorus vespilloides TaxID=110193 RepID=A0ABM1NKH6_NICVS|nr:PREDICTED: uncharacterized protein LOC108570026 [Nicrophorus vespilloides]
MFVFYLLLCVSASIAADEDPWYTYQFENADESREELIIDRVNAVDGFKTAESVLKWKSISWKRRSYALGITNTGIAVLKATLNSTENERFDIAENHHALDSIVLDADLFLYSSKDEKQTSLIALVLTSNQKSSTNVSVDLNWYDVTKENQFEKILSLNLNKNVTYSKVIKTKSKHLLLIGDVLGDEKSLAIYEFSLRRPTNYWLIQVIKLNNPILSTAFVTYGYNSFLVVAQETDVQIFIYTNGNFTNSGVMEVKHVRHVSSFTIGSRAYLAVDGWNAGIYRFTKSGLVQEKIKDDHFEGVDFWLPMSLKTYKDEEILLAERFLDHGSHKTYTIDVVIHNGRRFAIHDEMICNYYGEETHGMNCLVEEESTWGIKGSAILNVGNLLGILIPRKNASSGLFMIHTSFRDLPDPMDLTHLKELKQQFDKDLKRQMEEIAKIKEQLEPKVETAKEVHIVQQQNVMWDNKDYIEELKLRVQNIRKVLADMKLRMESSNLKDRKFKHLVVNDLVEVKGSSNVKDIKTVKFNGRLVDDVFGDIVSKDNMKHIPSLKTFQFAEIKNISFDSINGIDKTKIAFTEDVVRIKGDVVFENPVTVGKLNASTLNNLVLENEIIKTGAFYKDPLSFEQLNVVDTLSVDKINSFPIHKNYLDAFSINANGVYPKLGDIENVYIPGNVTVNQINGENLDDFIKSLCLTNIKTYVPSETTIIGDLIVKEKADTVKFNKLSFLDDYLFGISNSFIHIKGKKMFSNPIFVNELVTFETIGGVDPNELVTMTTQQEIFGKFTFQDLEVTESLDIIGNVTGVNLEDFLPNVGITKTKHIMSDISFKNLEVEGTIYVENRFNRSNLDEILENVIYKNEDFAEIHALKGFANGFTVQSNLNLLSNKINNFDLDSFIHKESQEIIKAKILRGLVTFENLELSGNIGDVNLTNLDQECVKLSGEQFISSELIFEEDLNVGEIEILGGLNEIPVSDYFYTDSNSVLLNTKFDRIKVSNLIVEGNLNTIEDNFNLQIIDQRRLSFTRDQQITADYKLNTSNMYNLVVNNVNNYQFKELFDVDVVGEILKKNLLENKYKIKDLIVEETLSIESVNGIPMKNITKNCVWSQENDGPTLAFKDNVYVKEIITDNFNDIPFQEMLENVVFKNETDDVRIDGFKLYANGYEVLNYMVSPRLNAVKMENILLKSGRQQIKSPVIVFGDVLIRENAEVLGNINEIPVNYFVNSFESLNENTYRIKENVMFSKVAYVKQLNTQGFINKINISEFMMNRVDVNQDQRIPSELIFEDSVSIDANLIIKNQINGLDMINMKDELLYITQDAVVNVPIQFQNPVVIREEFILDDDFNSQFVDGVNVSDWVNAIYINKGFIPETVKFDWVDVRGRAEVEFLNGISMLEVIPLKTEQVISKTLAVSKLSVFRDLSVGNLVNGVNLQDQYLNSIISNRNQGVNSRVIFESNVLVRDVLEVIGNLNGYNVSSLVTTNTVQNLTASYKFTDKTTVANHVIAYGLVNNINISEWTSSAVYKYAETPQTINQPWKANNITFGNNVLGSGKICGFEIRKLADRTEERRVFKTTVESEIINQYGMICKDINKIISASRDQIYLFSYLDYYQYLEFENDIANVHKFEYLGKAYLLVSEENSCKSSLFLWAEHGFQHLRYIQTGLISQVITVRDGDFLFLITRSDVVFTNCSIENSNIWKFEADDLMLLYNLGDQILLQDSLKPGTFYTMDKDAVNEFLLTTVIETDLRKIRRWYIPTENAAFIPRGLKTSLAIRNGRKIFYLNTNDVVDMAESYDAVVIGNVTVQEMHLLPGRNGGELLRLNVGYPRRRTFLAYASHEETSVRGRLDFIKIYEDILTGTLYHKVPTYKPSSLISLEFGENGETLLIFMEDEKNLQIYEYKGIEGFKLRSTAVIAGKQLVPLIIPREECPSKNHVFIGSINANRLTILQAIMQGDKIEQENIHCVL